MRVVNLSLSYLTTILPHLEWFRGCSGMADLPVLLLNKACKTDLSQLPWYGPAAWRLKPRNGVLLHGSLPTKLSVIIGQGEIKKLTAGESIFGEIFYRNGFYVGCVADPKTACLQKKTLSMGLFTHRQSMEAALGMKWTNRQGVAVRYTWSYTGCPRAIDVSATLTNVFSNTEAFVSFINRPNVEEVVSLLQRNGGVLSITVNSVQ